MKRTGIGFLLMVIAVGFPACQHSEKHSQPPVHKPTVTEGGQQISFPDRETARFFKTEKIVTGNLEAQLTAPARVVAIVVRSAQNAEQNLVLFDNAEQTGNYTAFLQHLTNIKLISQVNTRQRKIELERAQDLAAHGVATGKEVLEAQTALASEQTALTNEKTAILEQETKLKLAGFDPGALIHARAGTVWLICDIPENQLGRTREGGVCQIQFTSFPQEKFAGRIEDVGEIVDNITRMVKFRIAVTNPGQRLKAGMFATVQFGLAESALISVPREALVTVQGRDFVFVKKNTSQFERREVKTGQQINDRIVIYTGLGNGEEVVTAGAMQLKGLSFGY